MVVSAALAGDAIAAISSANTVAARIQCGSANTPNFSARHIAKIRIGAMIRITPSGDTFREAALVAAPAGCGCSAGETSASTPSTRVSS